ncbi:hypothetical protein E2C01_063758 [Portunus trituberculatus]|uniref:Uncharacterized protein n=1 Tax=Portunus trituberculatus TaxID=210409 RepID=A0A5B7HEJ0_PORTR|nr:hypothetical protein [Portunus trituberculatus]
MHIVLPRRPVVLYRVLMLCFFLAHFRLAMATTARQCDVPTSCVKTSRRTPHRRVGISNHAATTTLHQQQCHAAAAPASATTTIATQNNNYNNNYTTTETKTKIPKTAQHITSLSPHHINELIAPPPSPPPPPPPPHYLHSTPHIQNFMHVKNKKKLFNKNHSHKHVSPVTITTTTTTEHHRPQKSPSSLVVVTNPSRELLLRHPSQYPHLRESHLRQAAHTPVSIAAVIREKGRRKGGAKGRGGRKVARGRCGEVSGGIAGGGWRRGGWQGTMVEGQMR